MKLYSRGQVILFSSLSAALALLLVFGFAFIKPRLSKPVSAPAAVSPLNDRFEDEYKLSQSDYNVIPVSDDLNQFSAGERENITIYERLNSAVVNITTEVMAINWFLEPVPQEGTSGSGSIIDTNGFVLTNNHVIQNAHRVFVNLADGSQFEGRVIGIDPENDLAVLKFDPPAGTVLTTINYGNSDNLRVGQKVLAIGNPFALERTLTVGIVSGLGRPIQTSRNRIIRDMIQTDASINPGNSGGPLLDTQGRMIGINTMIYSPTGGSVGIGFAVPVNTARRVVSEIMQHGRVRRGWMDATVVQLFPSLVRYARLPVESGLLVSRTRRGGLAERAGLRQGAEPVQYGRSVIYLGGDIITSVNGMPTNTLADLYSSLEASRPGDIVTVEIIRGGQTSTLRVTLADREEIMRTNQ
ncbi:MAG: trypsin-like peptidase domain-containing protein [Treponema sp.]|nr:trypsin-like peptidase domain-containing protein [Treponema sp.]MCL2237908.1 trypsin-like peptidase domain-containing protein [Treponema sp.]